MSVLFASFSIVIVVSLAVILAVVSSRLLWWSFFVMLWYPLANCEAVSSALQKKINSLHYNFIGSKLHIINSIIEPIISKLLCLFNISITTSMGSMVLDIWRRELHLSIKWEAIWCRSSWYKLHLAFQSRWTLRKIKTTWRHSKRNGRERNSKRC